MKKKNRAASLLARAAVVALVAFSASFVAGCGKDKGEKELKAGIEACKAQNFDEAQKLFESAAEKGNDDAVFMLGSVYLLVKNDEAKAFDFYRKAAKAGNVKAQVVFFVQDLRNGKIGDDEAAKKLDEFGAKLKELVDNGDEMAKEIYEKVQEMKEHPAIYLNDRKAKANTDCLSLMNAIICYEAEFSQWPANVSGDALVTGGDYIEMCKLLTGGNSKKMVFYEADADYNEAKGVLDPWGRPYQVALDGDFDGFIKGIPAIKEINKASGRGGQDLRNHAAVYSFGVDEKDKNANDVAKLAEEKKLITSW